MSHGYALQVEDDDTTEYLGPGFHQSKLDDDDRGLENLVNRVLARIPVAHSVDHHATTARGSVSWNRHYVVIADVPHLHGVHVLVNLGVFFLEGVVSADLKIFDEI